MEITNVAVEILVGSYWKYLGSLGYIEIVQGWRKDTAEIPKEKFLKWSELCSHEYSYEDSHRAY